MNAIRVPLQSARTVKLLLRTLALGLAAAGGAAKIPDGSNGLLIAGIAAGLVVSVAGEVIGETIERGEKRRLWKTAVVSRLAPPGGPPPRADSVSPYRVRAAASALTERLDRDG